MTHEQADQIIDYLFGMLRPPDPDATRASWRRQLEALDVGIASRAAVNGVQVWERFPSWPSFYAEYQMVAERTRSERKECPLCGGDRFVFVSTRTPLTTKWMREREIEPPEESSEEEYAHCPECNSHYETQAWRFDGTPISYPDPETVRRLLAS